jgi:hypothetical protein
VAGLAAALAERRRTEAPAADASARSLVWLTPPGAERALFCVHPGGGSSGWYRHLAERMGSRPLAAFEAPGLDAASEPLARTEDLAARYVAELRAVQPAGPYHLLAWCGGSGIAFEMARLLQSAGERIDPLVLVDPTVDVYEQEGARVMLAAFERCEALFEAWRQAEDERPAVEAELLALLARIVDDDMVAPSSPDDLNDQLLRRLRVWHTPPDHPRFRAGAGRPDGGAEPRRLDGRRATARRPLLAGRAGLAGDRRPPPGALRRGPAPAGAAPAALAARASLRARHPARPQAGPAPRAPGGRACRDPSGRPPIRAGRGAGTARGSRVGAVGRGPGTAGRADRGLGRRAQAGGAVAGRAPRPGAVRRSVLGRRAQGCRVPARRGPGVAAGAGEAADAADCGAGAGERTPRRPADRRHGRRTDPAGAGGRQRLPGLAGRWPFTGRLPCCRCSPSGCSC